jgi:hypothetical protein
MTTVDDRMPTKDLEVEVREPAWSTKVRLVRKSHGCSGARCRDRCSAHGCAWTCRHVCDLVAIR